jgi:hypothetical protein
MIRLVQRNPNGVESLSPRLAAPQPTLGMACYMETTLKGLCHWANDFCNPFRVEIIFDVTPRVAPRRCGSDQPWAEGCNPVGIVPRMKLQGIGRVFEL